MPVYWISLVFTNFALAMFCLAVLFMVMHRLFTRGRVRQEEIVYRWLAVFCLGFTGLYTCVIHAYFPQLGALVSGCTPSAFQFDVAVADLGFAILGIFSFKATYGFRLATVIGNTIWLWGVAIGMVLNCLSGAPFNPVVINSWLGLDILVPLILLICISRLKPAAYSI